MVYEEKLMKSERYEMQGIVLVFKKENLCLIL